MTPKTLVLLGTLMHFLGSLGIGWSLLEYRWTGQFDTFVRPWTTVAFVAYVLGYIPILMGALRLVLGLRMKVFMPAARTIARVLRVANTQDS
jgi:hypothetical protein